MLVRQSGQNVTHMMSGQNVTLEVTWNQVTLFLSGQNVSGQNVSGQNVTQGKTSQGRMSPNLLGVLPFVEDPDFSVNAVRATSATLG